MADSFSTIGHRSQCEMKVLGSRFIADVVPVEDRLQAEAELEAVRKRLHDATHHCYAYRVGTGGEQYRLHDDGEPGGSAGRPILAAIDRHGLTNVLVIVTRYFGGTKLGVGGLARTYGEAAESGLTTAGRRECYRLTQCTATFAHAHTNAVMRLAAQLHAKIAAARYEEQVTMTLEIRESLSDQLRAALVETTRGQVVLDPP
jgi:uncharacterized YigZ family protein